MQAKCTCGFERKLPDGTRRKYVSGMLYDIDELPTETQRRFFEHPELTPTPAPVTTKRAKKTPRAGGLSNGTN